MEGFSPSVMKSFAQGFTKFVDASPTPFHVCSNAAAKLEAAGFKRLSESVSWKATKALNPGGKYYYTRNSSCLIAFCVGGKFEAGNAFKVVGAHTDSPVLMVKPNSNRTSHGYIQVGAECYGGGLWHTWLDRDLGIAGRVLVKKGETKFEQHLVHVDKPILRVPSLCIHLQTAEERAALKLNKEDHLTPILGLITKELNAKTETGVEDKGLDPRHAPALLKVLGEKIGCKPEEIIDVELSLCDTQKGAIGGVADELIFTPRVDNQVHCYTSLEALISYSNSGKLDSDPDVSVIALFDHEEVGSDSNEGAGSPIMRDAVVRISSCFAMLEDNELFKVGLSKSLLLSADAAHAIHPNYASKHEQNHQPKIGEGTVIKTNQNQRYATNCITGFVVRELCRRHSLPVQEFVVRNDCPCGSTIGPIIAHNVGMRTVDIGIPQLSMHSIRETCGVNDVYTNYKLLEAFFDEGLKVDQSITVIESNM
mmetsp:Transcript_11349/g.12869  ORF Transcript_11349/g.12869 Transcript_11349/m.12869 type:complete len:480 (+) Transcript_11349:213-1652(+)|eukprot:CAMPEP_0204824090 /NCGR_PEP_ID=MMETSP1346-20131115/2137_1 /ASSEMBLY_ACC=CAM_ASM_000771 /TAXON_ID=215587 /ORGANISM="Aplanochytrium stocchinoi, Strain GSBS06" /LENGTH=479 /DNA_ID=CAMNT_0051951049 /DNA_START=147 /DNA_END=1586 /DNA_ORIENTATION=+